MSAEKAVKFGEDTPLGRTGQPAELAGAYVLLASELRSYMTGSGDRGRDYDIGSARQLSRKDWMASRPARPSIH